MTQAERGAAFQSLHRREGAFIIPNPWDAGTARLLARLGFEALATTSAGFAFSKGVKDGRVSREPMLAHVREIVDSTDLPVSADLENGYGATPEEVAETYRLAAETGLVGASIEDATGNADAPILDIARAAERVQAAAEAVHGPAIPFTLTARAENYLCGRPNLSDTIARLQAYQEAGADVLYAPGLTSKSDIASVVSSVDRPVNVLAGLRGMAFTLEELSELGVKRVSVGSALSRVALSSFLNAAREMRDQGTFGFASTALGYAEIGAMFD